MTTNAEAREKFWSALKSDMTVMLALGDQPTEAQPMTAQLLDEAPEGPIFFFTSIDTDIARAVEDTRAAFFTFADKGHALFATVEGSLQIHNDRAVIEALWNPFVAAWFDGKDDPKICLLRFGPVEGQIWFDAKSLIAGIKMMLGVDPKEDYKDKTAHVLL
ncbi:MAG: pyridoxamine 5'-phosphate oxidase family protein [Deltaproteobacteria bacterium]